MKHLKLTKNQKVIVYLIKRLGDLIEGRKKLMKLMFLIEHYDTENEKLIKTNFLGNNFIIYHYGVFSFEVMNDYISLNNRGIVTEYPIKTKLNVKIEKTLKSRIDNIVLKFSKMHGFELEEETLKMLNIDKKSKELFFGKNVKELIKK